LVNKLDTVSDVQLAKAQAMAELNGVLPNGDSLWNRNDESRLMEENGRALYDKRFA
jgi:hypothetical protein